MVPTLILGPTGSGKTTALMRRYEEWVRQGFRTDQIFVLTSGSVQTARWRRELSLTAGGPVEAYSFFGFVQRELELFWAPVQAAVPELQAWLRPEFLDAAVAQQLMRALLEPYERQFAEQLQATPERIAMQLSGNLTMLGAAAGLEPRRLVQLLAGAAGPDRSPVYQWAGNLLETFRARCLQAGMLDYGLALRLYTTVLLHHSPYLDHLRSRYRCLLVDDLDETTPVAQDLLALLAPHMEQAVYAFGTDGGHTRFMGADPERALERFRPGAQVEELHGSRTCSPEAFALGEALAHRILGGSVKGRSSGVVAGRIVTDLRSDMAVEVADRVAGLVANGVPPAEIAIIAPYVEMPLERTVAARLSAAGVQVRRLSGGRRLLDEPYVWAVIVLAGLAQPAWHLPLRTPNAVARALQVVLGLDPVRAGLLGEAVAGTGALPDLGEAGLRSRLTPKRAEAYDRLRHWLKAARERTWEPDELVGAIVAEVMASQGALPVQQVHLAQQLLRVAERFRLARERFGELAFGQTYQRLLTEGTVAAEPLEGEAANAVILATPYAYLKHRLTSRFQVWVDISGGGWYPSDVKELTNPHVLASGWVEGITWNDGLAGRVRQRNAARLVRALARRCTGQIFLAESALTPWGYEQEGGLAEVFADLISENRS